MHIIMHDAELQCNMKSTKVQTLGAELLRVREALRKRSVNEHVTESIRKTTKAKACTAERLVARCLTLPGSL